MENDQGKPDFAHASDQLAGDFAELREAIMQRTDELRQTVGNFVHERPIASVGIAFGLGYVLSGAIYSRTTARLVGLGTRFLIGALVKQVVAGGGLGALAAMASEQGRDRDVH